MRHERSAGWGVTGAIAGLRAIVGIAAILLLGGQVAIDGVGRSTGLAVPRFVSLADAEVNLRYGPGTDFPIKWIYQREGLPVMIIDEFDVWRQIRDYEGEEGWVHQSLLSGRRRLLVTGEVRGLKRRPAETARVVLRAEPGVIGDLLECEVGWCRVEIDGRRGWLARDEFYGVLPDETFR
jgi:SH3-like domain-containing protein